MKKIIFTVEDEESIRELYKYALTDYEVFGFENGADFKAALAKQTPDLFLLDIMLPDTSDNELVQFVKNDVRYKDIPVIMVSAKGDEVSKVKLLNLGADDYIAKPFGVLELTARINANLRKSTRNLMTLCDVVINENEHSIKIANEKTAVTLKEYELLKFLMSNTNKTCERNDLLSQIWGINFEGETRTLDMHIKMLRDKLCKSGLEIVTLRGVGYMLRAKQ